MIAAILIPLYVLIGLVICGILSVVWEGDPASVPVGILWPVFLPVFLGIYIGGKINGE